ncbi:MAG: site-specific integrase, partial [Chloroflexota bacterium]|nr:site-specific integrase [Chloroflexota bacterium]
SEVAMLEVRHVQQRDGRWVIVDLVGKGRRTWSVPMPSWATAALDAWLDAARISDGRVFRSLRKGGRLNGAGMTDQAVADVVRAYAAQLAVPIAAHDLRRTFAKLAMKGGARLEQIQLSLGHPSIATTERYLGVEQDLTDAPCDRLRLRLQAV